MISILESIKVLPEKKQYVLKLLHKGPHERFWKFSNLITDSVSEDFFTNFYNNLHENL